MLRGNFFRGVCGLGFSTISLMCAFSGQAGATTISLGTAANYALLSGSGGISNNDQSPGHTSINGGNVGSTGYVGSFNSGDIASPYTINSESNYGGPGTTLATQAESDLVTAYNAAVAETPTQTITGSLGGLTLTPGVYDVTASYQAGTVTLNDNHQSDPLFVFQFPNGLSTGYEDFTVQTINDAGSLPGSNVFWQIANSASIQQGAVFQGHILSNGSITLNLDSTIIDGSALSENSISMSDNTIDNAIAVTVPSPSPLYVGLGFFAIIGVARVSRSAALLRA